MRDPDGIRAMLAALLDGHHAGAEHADWLADPDEWPKRIIVHPDLLDGVADGLAVAGCGDRFVVSVSGSVAPGRAVVLPAETSPDAPENAGRRRVGPPPPPENPPLRVTDCY